MIKIDFSRLGELLNDWVKNIFNNRSRFIVCKGGGGSGKSVGIAQILVYRMIAEKGHKMLIIRKVDNTLRDSCFSLIKEIINQYGCESLFKINKSDMTIENIYNGNIMIFKGLQDPERIKSINGITDIWIEEATELEVSDYRQLNIRLRTKSKYPLQMFITFNPVSITHWLKAEFFDIKKDNALTIETNYKDNRFLIEEARQVLESFKDTDPYYYEVYALGQWGVLGKTIFPSQLIQKRIANLKELYRLNASDGVLKGYFVYETYHSLNNDGEPVVKIKDDSIKFIEDDNGYINIYKKPDDFIPYVIGADTAGGNGSDSDSHCGQVINNITGEQTATLRTNDMDEDLLADQLYCLGKYYNTALIAVEVNYSTHPQKCLERYEYPKLYLREIPDNIGVNVQYKYGFQTNSKTRPLLIANLVKWVRENVDTISDMSTLEEMLTFVRTAKGRAEAEQGSHDDTIMSLGIAHMARSQQSYLPVFETKEKTIRDILPDALIDDSDVNFEGDDDIW